MSDVIFDFFLISQIHNQNSLNCCASICLFKGAHGSTFLKENYTF